MPPPSSSGEVAVVGGIPTTTVDVPISAVFIAIFACLAAGHMTIFQINRRRGHKFIYSAALFGFCMARIATCSMRIVWAVYPTNTGVAVAAQILVNAGVLIVYIVNLVFAQRILRCKHPNFGFSKVVYFSYVALFALVPLCLGGVIAATIINTNTTDLSTLADDRHVIMTAISVLLFLAALPFPIIILTLLIPQSKATVAAGGRQDFGAGPFWLKCAVALIGTALICTDAGFRSATVLKAPVPAAHPKWYDARWAFYVFNFTIEVLTLGFYLGMRVDRRFWVPNGSKRPGDYYMLGSERAERPEGEEKDVKEIGVEMNY